MQMFLLKLLVLLAVSYFLDGKIESPHDNLNVLPDQRVVFFDDNLVEYEIKQEDQLWQRDHFKESFGESYITELEKIEILIELLRVGQYKMLLGVSSDVFPELV